MNISPPLPNRNAFIISLTTSFAGRKNLVILPSVTLISFFSFAISMNNGSTLPLDPMMLPLLTHMKSVSVVMLLACIISLSHTPLVIPYRLEGYIALSVEANMNFLIFSLVAAWIRFSVPSMLVLMASCGCSSHIPTCFNAAR